MALRIAKLRRLDLATFLSQHSDHWGADGAPLRAIEGFPLTPSHRHPPFSVVELIDNLTAFDPDVEYVFVVNETELRGDIPDYPERQKAPFVDLDSLQSFVSSYSDSPVGLCIAPNDDYASNGEYLTVYPEAPRVSADEPSKQPGITAIAIENFKGIGKRIEIDLRPITLLFGVNSAGKSSIIHALQYAREIFERRNLDADQTASGGELIDLGGFGSFVHGHDRRQHVLIGLRFDLNGGSLPSYTHGIPHIAGTIIEEMEPLLHPAQNAEVEVTVGWSDLLASAFVSCYAVSINGVPLAKIDYQAGSPGCTLSVNAQHPAFIKARNNTTIWNWHPLSPEEIDEAETAFGALLGWAVHTRVIQGIGRAAAPYTEIVGLTGQKDALPDWDNALSFGGEWDVSPQIETEPDNPTEMVLYLAEALSEIVIGPGKVLKGMLDKLRYLGPLRQVPSRNYSPPRFRDTSSWASGLAAWDLLLKSQPEFVERVQRWLGDRDKLNTGYRVEPKQFKELDQHQLTSLEGLFSRLSIDSDAESLKRLFMDLIESSPWGSRLALYDVESDVEVEPQDVGVGVSQLVPVVVAILDEHDGLTAIEQPELHLHPAVQVAIGDLLIEGMWQAQSRVLLVETHSEHVMLRLLRRVREASEGALPSEHPGLDPSQVNVVYVEKDNSGVKVSPLRMDATGEFRDRWPKGFFDERAAELF